MEGEREAPAPRAHAKPEGDPALQMLKLEMPKDASRFGDTCLKYITCPVTNKNKVILETSLVNFFLQLGLQS